MGQLDWGGRVQGEGKLTAGCPTVGLVPPGGLGRQCRRPGHQAVTEKVLMCSSCCSCGLS